MTAGFIDSRFDNMVEDRSSKTGGHRPPLQDTVLQSTTVEAMSRPMADFV